MGQNQSSAEREKETETERERQRQRDRETERQRQRHRESEREREMTHDLCITHLYLCRIPLNMGGNLAVVLSLIIAGTESVINNCLGYFMTDLSDTRVLVHTYDSVTK